ncbi:DNA topoisomerase [Klebsiella michiganensis]|uniref:DNA topoisomerase n=1 Tax=Klebsiella michiganensis TaxID=1134687 RepID=UPI001D0EE5A3
MAQRWKNKKTSPPPPFTEGTLIAAMKNAASFVSDPKLKKVLRDNAGLGTEATRAGVLETLFSRNYLEEKRQTYPCPRCWPGN